MEENLHKVETFYETQLSSFLEQFHNLALQVRLIFLQFTTMGSSFHLFEAHTEPLFVPRNLTTLFCAC